MTDKIHETLGELVLGGVAVSITGFSGCLFFDEPAPMLVGVGGAIMAGFFGLLRMVFGMSNDGSK